MATSSVFVSPCFGACRAVDRNTSSITLCPIENLCSRTTFWPMKSPGKLAKLASNNRAYVLFTRFSILYFAPRESFLAACCCYEHMRHHSHTTSVGCDNFEQCSCLWRACAVRISSIVFCVSPNSIWGNDAKNVRFEHLDLALQGL